MNDDLAGELRLLIAKAGELKLEYEAPKQSRLLLQLEYARWLRDSSACIDRVVRTVREKGYVHHEEFDGTLGLFSNTCDVCKTPEEWVNRLAEQRRALRRIGRLLAQV